MPRGHSERATDQREPVSTDTTASLQTRSDAPQRPYNGTAFDWPARPELAVSPDMLDYYEQRGWWAQIKKNGTGNLITVTPEREIAVMRRDNTRHKQWTPLPEIKAAFADLPGDSWYKVSTELLHSKVGNLRHINYIHDIIVADGRYLTGTTFAERQALLRKLFPTTTRSLDGHYYVIDQHTWLAHNYTSGFAKLFASLTRDDDEGLVLKDPKARLALCLRENSNSSWQRKCRRPHKNYGF